MKEEVSCNRNGQLGENPTSLSSPSWASGWNRKHTGKDVYYEGDGSYAPFPYLGETWDGRKWSQT